MLQPWGIGLLSISNKAFNVTPVLLLEFHRVSPLEDIKNK